MSSNSTKDINEMIGDDEPEPNVSFDGSDDGYDGAYVSIEIGENNVIKLQKSAIANILPKGTIDSIK